MDKHYCSVVAWQVYWTRVPDLVSKRRILLRGGYAFVPSKELSSFVFNEFERKLEIALEVGVLTRCIAISLKTIVHFQNASPHGRGHEIGAYIEQPVPGIPLWRSIGMGESLCHRR